MGSSLFRAVCSLTINYFEFSYSTLLNSCGTASMAPKAIQSFRWLGSVKALVTAPRDRRQYFVYSVHFWSYDRCITYGIFEKKRAGHAKVITSRQILRLLHPGGLS